MKDTIEVSLTEYTQILEYLNHNNITVKVFARTNGYFHHGQRVIYDFEDSIDASTIIDDAAYFPCIDDEELLLEIIRLNNTWYSYDSYDYDDTTLHYEIRERLDEEEMKEAVFYSGRKNEY